jgi:nitrite reductase/ring-hydroxylating ferredoxin subunit/uncharacterized membrane protein
MGLHEIAVRIGSVEALDRLVQPLSDLSRRLVPHGPVKDVLSGTWLGHPVHPMLTDVVIGSFTSATVLDLVGGKRSQRGANRLTLLGIVSAVPTAAAGLSDWSETYGEAKRVGVVHASANVVGLALYAASVWSRLRHRRAKAASLGLLGMGVMTVGGYLGGHLSYVKGVGVNNTFWQHPPDDWVPVLDETDLPEAQPVKVNADGATVLLYRRGGRLYAIGGRCSHAGGPLDEGVIDATALCVTCPWHQSVFRLDDGGVVHGPATVPQPRFDVRVEGGKIEVRAAS